MRTIKVKLSNDEFLVLLVHHETMRKQGIDFGEHFNRAEKKLYEALAVAADPIEFCMSSEISDQIIAATGEGTIAGTLLQMAMDSGEDAIKNQLDDGSK